MTDAQCWCRVFAGTVSLAFVVVLAGCGTMSSSIVAQVPTSGPIQQGEQISTNREDQFIRVIARGPVAGMTSSEIVQGFLDASASFDGDHAVARQYLTDDANRRWEPSTGVAVYEGAGELAAYGYEVTLTASEAGRISVIGHYDVAAPGTELKGAFTLVREQGEWRINRAPPGLILSLADVDRSFRSLSVYFFDPTFSTLVPDPRMIPVLGPGQATTLVKYLVAGPSEWLLPAVRTGFPNGVGLGIESVPIVSGVAVVDLTPDVRLASDSARQALSQQLVWTLRQVPGVSDVSIAALGQPLSVPGVAAPQPRDSWPGVDPGGLPPGSSGFVARSESVVRLSAGGAKAVLGGAGEGQVSFVDIAVSRASDFIAGIDPEGTLWRGPLGPGRPLTKLLSDANLANPVFDRSGALWVVDADEGLILVRPDSTRTSIRVSGLEPRARVRSATPSRDGTRAALVVQSGPRTSLFLGRIVRAGPGGEITIDDPIKVESKLTEVVDIGWSGADSIAVLGSVEAGSLEVFDIDLARGSVTALGAPEAPVSIAAAPGLLTLVGGADGQVYEATAGTWRVRTNGTSPAYPN
jgi:hypothetical protein